LAGRLAISISQFEKGISRPRKGFKVRGYADGGTLYSIWDLDS